MRSRSRIAVLMAVLGLFAAACSSGDDTTSTDDGSEETTTTTAGAGEDESESSTTTSEASTTSEQSEELTASFRGVTEDTIKVGVAVPDFDALQAAGITNYQGDADVAFQAFFDVINEEGGIYGRQIEPVYTSFDFLEPSTQDSACAELTEDEEVFIVLYGLLGAANLCLTELHDTMVMTRSFQTTQLRESSGDTAWIQLNAADDARTRNLGLVTAEAGLLDGKTVGIVASNAEADGLDGRVLQDTLAEVGIDSTLLVSTADASDTIARDGEIQVFAEKFNAEGVDFLFDLWGGGDNAATMASAGFTPELAYKALGASVDGASDRTLLDGALGVGEINEESMLADADFQASCMDVVRTANPELEEEMSFIPSGDEQAAGQPNWINPVMIACDQTMLLKMIGEIAGADLTNDSFRAALDELGPVELHGYGQASFDSESKWDGLDEFYLVRYDAASDSVEIVGDPIIVER